MTTLRAYIPNSDDEILLLAWYTHLRDSGDLQTTFLPTVHTVSGFLAQFASSDLLIALDDTDNVWAAVWVESMGGTPFLGIWVDEPARGSLRAASFLLRANQLTTAAYPTLLALTRQPLVVELAQRLGYTTHGWIPGLWSGYPAYLLSSTKESRDGWRQRRRQQQPSGAQAHGD